MNQFSKLAIKVKPSLLFCVPLISVIGVSPSYGVTIASSEAGFRLNNFSSSPLNVDTAAFTVTFTEAEDSSTIASGEARATFSLIEPFAINETRSFASGIGDNFFGLADSTAQVLGNFAVASDEAFSFDFDGFLNLSTSTPSANGGDAIAAATISWLLIDNTESDVVGFFDVFAQLDTIGDNDIFISPQGSDNVTIDFLNTESSFGATASEEFVTTDFAGSLNTSFSEPTSLTLVEIKNSFAVVEKTPEPNSIVGIFTLSFLGLVVRNKNK